MNTPILLACYFGRLKLAAVEGVRAFFAPITAAVGVCESVLPAFADGLYRTCNERCGGHEQEYAHCEPLLTAP